MRPIVAFLVAISIAYGCAMSLPLKLILAGRSRAILVGGFLVAAVLLCPLIIPATSVGLRAISAVISGDLGFKMVDFLRRWDRVDRGGPVRSYRRHLVPFPMFAVVGPSRRRRRGGPETPWPDVARLVAGTAGVVAAILILRGLSGCALIRTSFAVDHPLMLAMFVVAIESLSRALLGLERLAGFDTTPIVRNILRSRTVAEFWRRYNDRVHDWFLRNVFEPAGGRRVPVRSVVLVFVVSGLFHELMFGIATSRFTGYQFLFFALQAPAVLGSGRLGRFARRGGLAGKALAHGLTITYLALTSVFFFDGVRRVFPFLYAGPSPLPW